MDDEVPEDGRDVLHVQLCDGGVEELPDKEGVCSWKCVLGIGARCGLNCTKKGFLQLSDKKLRNG